MPLLDACEICIIHKRSEDLRARNTTKCISRDNPNRRRAIYERTNECDVKFHKRVRRDRLAWMHYTGRPATAGCYMLSSIQIKGDQCEATQNLFRAAFNCRMKRRLRMMYVRVARARVFCLSVPSECILRDALYNRAEKRFRVGFDLDERCTLVKYSLPRSIFWKSAIFSSRRERRK